MRNTGRGVAAVVVLLRVLTCLAGPSSGPASRPALSENVKARVDIYPQEIVRKIGPRFPGTNLTQYATDRKQIKRPETLERVRGLGIRTVRFPNGCFADLYNWQQPKADEVTVDEFVDFCDAIGAEPYYTLNMQGGTEGREGTPAAGSPLEEVIKYRHLAPNPCGYTKYFFGTLPEALAFFQKHTIDRALAGKTPILQYELGNENWGQAKSDWTPPVYGKNAEVWCQALRRAWTAAQELHASLRALRLCITAVGYPTMGNNQDPLKTVDRDVNRAWTAEINRLADLKLIDAVTEHFYPFPSNIGDSLYWAVHNLHNILALRAGAANERLGGYRDETLSYRVPIEVTEWNIKCWGSHRLRTDMPLKNGGFEQGMEGWTARVDPPSGGGQVETTSSGARRGKLGLELRTSAEGKEVEVRQRVSVADREKSAALGAYVWVRTPTPGQVRLSVREVGAATGSTPTGSEKTATQVNMWERLAVTLKPTPSAKEIEFSIRLTGAGARARVDEIQPLQWDTFSDNIPSAADHYEQQLFAVDAIREMLAGPVTRTHWHHLFGDYPCPQLTGGGAVRDNSVPFQLLAGHIGHELIRTRCDVPGFSYDTAADAIATDFNAVVPDVSGIPALSALATREGKRVFVLLINRTTDRKIVTAIALHGAQTRGDVTAHVMTGEDLDLPGARLEHRKFGAPDLVHHEVAPLSAELIEMTLE